MGSDGERRAEEEQRDDVPCLADVGVDEQRARGLALIWLRLRDGPSAGGASARSRLGYFRPLHCFVFNLHMRVAPALRPP